MKILHVSFVGELSKGLRAQLSYEEKAAENLGSDVHWETKVFHNGEPRNTFEAKAPFWARNFFMRKLFAWIFLLRNSKEYDVILQRYIVFDPFCILFSPFLTNRVTVHHSKEVEELSLIRSGWKGSFASWLEKKVGRFGLKHAMAIVGVTEEIAAYELQRIGKQIPSYTFPNGTDLNEVFVLQDRREETTINIAFVCSDFVSWQGLDRVLMVLRVWKGRCLIRLHLIGKMGNHDNQLIKEINRVNNAVDIRCHGYLDRQDFIKILSYCDIGLSSFGIDRKGLKEACTLKVREYLGMGIPVFSGHKDTALPTDFPYYMYQDFNAERAVEYAMFMKSVKRQEVRDRSYEYIDKFSILRRFVMELRCFLCG